MTPAEYEKLAMRTYGGHGVEYLMMGLVGEVGEVCNYLKKTLFHGHTFDAEKLREEAGDVLWYAFVAAKVCGAEQRGIVTFDELQRGACQVSTFKDDVATLSLVLNICAARAAEAVIDGVDSDKDVILKIRSVGPVLGILLQHYGITLESAAVANIRKLMKRYPNGFSTEDSINRTV